MMKKSIRSLFSLLLMLTLVLSLCGSALAADTAIIYKGRNETPNEDGTYGGNFDFDNKYGNAYTATDLFDSFKNVMPGDTLTQKVTFKNEATDSDFVKLSMVVVPHDETNNPLSEEVAVKTDLDTMTKFLQQLEIKVYKDSVSEENLLFPKDDEVKADVAGVDESPIDLGIYRTGEHCTLIVELGVPLTMGNEFAHKIGEIDWKFTVEAYNESQLVVRKVWSDGNSKHADESVTVWLLKDGEREKSAVLDASNDWQYVFDRLVEGHEWDVEEADVPSGYTVSYKTEGNVVTITNTKDRPYNPPTPTPTPSKPTPPKDEPVEIEPETSDIHVTKVWEDDGVGRPGSVTVNLLKNGVVFDTATLSEATGWTYAWTELEDGYTWSVEEANVPEGYEVSYDLNGEYLTITNSKLKNINVSKVWSGDDEKSRPGSVNVTLYDGDTAVETVQLGQWNDWSYSWQGLSASGNWQVMETSIPKGYTPSYSVSGEQVTITNTATLIQTGQLNWPIPVMTGCGILLLALACVMLKKKKKA